MCAGDSRYLRSPKEDIRSAVMEPPNMGSNWELTGLLRVSSVFS